MSTQQPTTQHQTADDGQHPKDQRLITQQVEADDASHHDQNGKDQLDSVAAGRDIFDFMLRCHVSSLEICSLRLP